MIMLSMISCAPQDEASGNPSYSESGNAKLVSETAITSGSSTFTIPGKEGTLYGIIPSGNSTRSTAAPDTGLTKTENGTYLYLSDGNDMTFSGSDISFASGTVRNVEYIPSSGEMVIDTSSDTPTPGTSDIFEKYYITDLAGINAEDKKSIFLTHTRDRASGEFSYDYGIISGNEIKMSNAIKGITDLSASDSVHIFHQVKKKEGDMKQRLVFMTPQKLEPNAAEIEISTPSAFMIEETGTELVLEIHLKRRIEKYSFYYMLPDAQTANGGKHLPYFMPMSYDDSDGIHKVILYIGKLESPAVFSISTGEEEIDRAGEEVILREITDEERALLTPRIIDNKITLSFESDDWIVPVNFKGMEGIENIKSISGDFRDTGTQFRLTEAGESGAGFTTIDGNHKDFSIKEGFSLEYGFLINEHEASGEITLTLKEQGLPQQP